MRISVLDSGSKGNSTVIELNNCSFLIDVGISFKSLLNRLLSCNVELNKISSVFITHEHVDHINGLKPLLNRTQLLCYLSKGTYESLNKELKDVIGNNYVLVKNGDVIEIDGVKITVIQTHHDAAEPIGFVIEEKNKKVVYITDTGYVEQVYYPLLSNADMYIMESNYDVELLWSSNRPFMLKKRIDGDHGHMSNEASAILLSKLIGANTKHVLFAHISDDCNYYHTLDFIKNAHIKIYNEYGIDYSNISFTYGNRNGVSGVFEI